MATYDIIGDVHGCASMLHGLLGLLGWERSSNGLYEHADADRKAVFVGDLVDRGTEQLTTLETVRSMVDAGSAHIVLGNHEFNAISYAIPDPAQPGEFLRQHTPKNVDQHKAFVQQLSDDQRTEWLDWFRTLPLWLELDGLRVAHASWHQASIEVLSRELGGNRFPAGNDAFVRANRKGDPIWEAVEVILKGPEIELAPYGLPPYIDKGGRTRYLARARWWCHDARSIRDLIDLPVGTTDEHRRAYPPIPDVPCSDHDRSFSYSDPVPVVYGHHWRDWEPDEHVDWTSRTACVDFSAVGGGHLVAYQWSGETQIDPGNYRRFPAGHDAG